MRHHHVSAHADDGGNRCGARKSHYPLARVGMGRVPDLTNDVCRIFGSPPHWNRFENSYQYTNRSKPCDVSNATRHLLGLDGIGFMHSLNSTLNEWRRIFGLPPPSAPAERTLPIQKRTRPLTWSERHSNDADLRRINPSSQVKVIWEALPTVLRDAIDTHNTNDSWLWRTLLEPCARACGAADVESQAGLAACGALLPQQGVWRCSGGGSVQMPVRVA